MVHHREILQHLVRTVLAFCRLAEHADDDAREDLVDACASLLDLWTTQDPPSRDAALHRWCLDASSVLGRLGDIQGHALLRAQARLLRLRASLPQPANPVVATPAKPAAVRLPPRQNERDLGNNPKRVLQWLRENPGSRTRDMISHFAGELSDRTVMRSLKELAKAGLVRRTSEEGAVAYEAQTGENA